MNKRKFLKQAGAASVAAGLVLASRSSQAQAPGGDTKVLIVYHSVTGNTEKMAKGVAEGANGVWALKFHFPFTEYKMRNKIGAAFVTGASISNGKETTMQSIHAAMLINQMSVVSGGGAFGASATTGPDSPGVDEKELGAARALGKRVAEFAAITKRGSKS